MILVAGIHFRGGSHEIGGCSVCEQDQEEIAAAGILTPEANETDGGRAEGQKVPAEVDDTDGVGRKVVQPSGCASRFRRRTYKPFIRL